MKVSVSRRAHFNAAHRLNNPKWDDDENKRIFGKCNLPNYHGHNYEVIVSVKGEIDPETGFVMDLKLLNDLVQNEIVDRFDHKNLNLDTVEFQNLNPTAENIVVVIWNILRKKLLPQLELKVTLYETPRNFVEFAG